MKVRFVSPANIEFDEAVMYYDHQLPGLGFRFFQESEKHLIQDGVIRQIENSLLY